MRINTIDKERVIYSRFPSQSEIDAAYAVRIFLQHHPGQNLSLSSLIWEAGVPEQQLKAAFWFQFHERLEEYWERQAGK
jgi:hypothetical protein